MKLALIMLAAGNSRRFGSNKLLYEIEGKPMYLRTLEQLLRVERGFSERCLHAGLPALSGRGRKKEACRITVVTQYKEIQEGAEALGAQVLLNPHPERGISSSLKLGLEANQEADACLFAVADQPWLTAETILALTDRFFSSPCRIACVSHEGRLGNPCIFDRYYYPELLKLEGDTGGKRIILAHREDTLRLETGNQKELLDVDVRALSSKKKSSHSFMIT